MAKEVMKIAGRMIVYILLIITLIVIFYPESPKTKMSSSARNTVSPLNAVANR